MICSKTFGNLLKSAKNGGLCPLSLVWYYWVYWFSWKLAALLRHSSTLFFNPVILNKKTLHIVVLGVANIGVILLVLEVGLRIYSSFVPLYDLEMHKYAIELKRESTIPGLSHEHIPNSQAELMGVDFKINSLGFRDSEISTNKEDDEYRIMTLGCSNGVGWGVPIDSVFTELLESSLNREQNKLRYSVVNAGVGNYNTVMEHLQLKQKFSPVDPDMVIVHYYINDAEIVEHYNPGFMVQHSYLAALMHNRSQYSDFQKQHAELGDYYAALYEENAQGWKDAQSAILSIRKICSSAAIPLLFVLQPDLHNVSEDSKQAKCHDIISKFLDNSNIEYLDLLPAFGTAFGSEPQKAWVSSQDPHPNIAGHQLIYKKLYNYLQTRHSVDVN